MKNFLFCLALPLMLASCSASAETDDYATAAAMTQQSFDACHNSIVAYSEDPLPVKLEAADKYCAIAIAGYWSLVNYKGKDEFVKWLVDNSETYTPEDIGRWNAISGETVALARYIGLESLPAISFVVNRIATLEAEQKPL